MARLYLALFANPILKHSGLGSEPQRPAVSASWWVPPLLALSFLISARPWLQTHRKKPRQESCLFPALLAAALIPQRVHWKSSWMTLLIASASRVEELGGRILITSLCILPFRSKYYKMPQVTSCDILQRLSIRLDLVI